MPSINEQEGIASADSDIRSLERERGRDREDAESESVMSLELLDPKGTLMYDKWKLIYADILQRWGA